MMNGRFNRLVCAACIMLCGVFALPVTAADVYKPVNLQTVSRDLQQFKITSRYHLEKAMTDATNPFGTMPKNKALTVTTGKETLGNLARSAKKGTALAVATTAAVVAAGWAIDELTSQVTRPTEVYDVDPSDIFYEGYYFYNGSVSAATPIGVAKKLSSGTSYSIYSHDSSTGFTIVNVHRSDGSVMRQWAINRASCSSCPTVPTTTKQMPVPNADFDEEILPKLAPVPAYVWDQALKDPAGRPIITDELGDALHDWYDDLADRDPYLSYDRNTGKFTYNPPPEEPDVIPDPIDYDATPEVPTNPDEWDEAQAGSDWPSFCDWAIVVCDWLEWTKEEPEDMQPDELPVDELTVADFRKEYSSGLGNGSCPAPVSFTLQGQTRQFSYENACWAATNLFKPVLLMMAGIMAAFIIVGASRRAV